MSFSLNEVEATAKRAARGAEYSWGMAEEAAKAVRWLCANDMDGVHELAKLLERDAEDQAACPLRIGTQITDNAANLTQGSMDFPEVARPALVLPFLAFAARQVDLCLSLTSNGQTAKTDGHALSSPNEMTSPGQSLVIGVCDTVDSPREVASRATPIPEDWATLNRWAHLTYAPATEESRLLGAGAGLSDND
ncbi:DUF3726 domain-containing protein [uncultured Shimia sp.]|uniref:DUF3726 domain-containing protein n=1 Tax=uncultured Shimia sp. TaxID=573152 RepID=UPI002639F05C|nr:DUF3726 domain-containing protein [uncultured Shimia sp.]